MSQQHIQSSGPNRGHPTTGDHHQVHHGGHHYHYQHQYHWNYQHHHRSSRATEEGDTGDDSICVEGNQERGTVGQREAGW